MDYKYHRTQTITGSPDGELFEYPVKFTVVRGKTWWRRLIYYIKHRLKPTDLYLKGHSLCWPNDVRFKDEYGYYLSYWVESFDDERATIWVKINFIPQFPYGVKITAEYGKRNDVSASSGKDTFKRST